MHLKNNDRIGPYDDEQENVVVQPSLISLTRV